MYYMFVGLRNTFPFENVNLILIFGLFSMFICFNNMSNCQSMLIKLDYVSLAFDVWTCIKCLSKLFCAYIYFVKMQFSGDEICFQHLYRVFIVSLFDL